MPIIPCWLFIRPSSDSFIKLVFPFWSFFCHLRWFILSLSFYLPAFCHFPVESLTLLIWLLLPLPVQILLICLLLLYYQCFLSSFSLSKYYCYLFLLIILFIITSVILAFFSLPAQGIPVFCFLVGPNILDVVFLTAYMLKFCFLIFLTPSHFSVCYVVSHISPPIFWCAYTGGLSRDNLGWSQMPVNCLPVFVFTVCVPPCKNVFCACGWTEGGCWAGDSKEHWRGGAGRPQSPAKHCERTNARTGTSSHTSQFHCS